MKARPGVEVAGFSTTSSFAVARASVRSPSDRRRRDAVGGEPALVDVEADVAVVDRGHVVRRGRAGSARRPGRARSPRRARTGPRRAPRERRLLSIPKSTSPCGLPFVRSARLTASPASPPCRIRSFSPLSRSNAALTGFGIANESCVTRTTSVCFGARRSPAAARPDAQRDERTRARARACDAVSRRLLSRAGRTASRQPRSTVTRASRSAKTFETPRLVPGRRASRRGSGYASPSVVTPSRGPCRGSSETSSPGAPSSAARPADDVRRGVAEVCASISTRRVPLEAEQQRDAEQVVEPPAVRADDDDARRARARGRRRVRARDRWRPLPPDAARSARRPPPRPRAPRA